MKRHFHIILGVSIWTAAGLTLLGFTPEMQGTDQAVIKIFRGGCAVAGCHTGSYPAMGLDLSGESPGTALVGVESRGAEGSKLIDPDDPDRSYLLAKIRGGGGITGARMPLGRPPLADQDIALISDWARRAGGMIQPASGTASRQAGRPAFWGTRIINLVTPREVGRGRLLFRISHRYYPSAGGGYDVFYGLDGPASILLSFGYGITDRLDVTLSRSNRFKEVGLALKYKLFNPGPASSPLSAAVHLTTGLLTEKRAGISTFDADNWKFTTQISLAYRINPAISLLLVPSYTHNAAHWRESDAHTLALGTGARFVLFNETSLLVEWIPVLAGYHAKSQGWGLGIEKKIGGHVFQVFMLSPVGIPEAQHLPGGDLCIREGDVRFGFNIFRRF